MRFMWLGPGVLALAACKATEDPLRTPPIVVAEEDPDPLPQPEETTTSFRGNTWLVEELVIRSDTDIDGDGVVDNKLPEVLAAVDTLMRNDDMSVAAINDNIQSNIDHLVTIVFLDATSDGESIHIDVLTGMEGEDASLAVDPASYDAGGAPISALNGTFQTASDFVAGGEVVLGVTMMPGLPPSPVQLHGVELGATLDRDHLTIEGEMQGVIPVYAFIDEAVAPVIPEEGFEIFPGTVSSKEDILALLRDLAPGLADVTLPGGEPGISAAFTVFAGEWELSEP